MTGRFIVVEGPDGSGKSTLCRSIYNTLLHSNLPSPCHLTCEPSTGPIGQQIRRILRGEEPRPPPAHFMAFYAADRIHHLAIEVEPALDRGAIVICDRYVLSSYAYQHGVDGVPLVDVQRANATARPADLTIVLQVPPNICLDRVCHRVKAADFYDTSEAIIRQMAIYRRAEELLPRQHVVFVDSSANEQQTLAAAMTHILPLIPTD